MSGLARALLLALAMCIACPAIRADDEIARLTVKFGSVCCGTDGNAIARLTDVISSYERKIGRPIGSKRVYWGLEGEFTQCFLLVELDGPMRTRFVSDVRAAVQSATAKVEENVSCSGGWR